MREMNWQERLLAEECAARHRTPVAEVDHPKGVIVPGDPFMTKKIGEDRNYVPYCAPCTPMQRMRRVEDGFHCPVCQNHANWDLTPFNHNVDVQFNLDEVDPEWLAQHQAQVAAIKQHEALHQETYTEFKVREEQQQQRDWSEDRNKKNTSLHACGKCHFTFFGKKSRKYCTICQPTVTANVVAKEKPGYGWPVRPIRHGR